MKTHSVSKTAEGVAAVRALEYYHPQTDRLFEDRFACCFVRRGIIGLLRFPVIGSILLAIRERQFPGIMGNLLCRTRFIDDVLCNEIWKGIDQVVILGAGFDSRGYRISGINKTRVFEVDHSITQAWKQMRLKQMLGQLPSHVTFIPIDFNQQKLSDVMSVADFHTDANTFFIWEGVTQYITAEAVDATFQYISRVAAPGSKIVFTYIQRGIIDGSVLIEETRRLISNLKRQGEPWIFGIDPAELDQYLDSRGFALVEQTGASEYRTRYLNPLGRQMNLFEGERVVLAEILDTLHE